MLTKKQKILLDYIQTCLQSSGVSPSFEEMKEYLGLKSKSGVHRLISALEERGFLKRLANRARALEVIKLPHNLTNISGISGAPDDTKNLVSASKLSLYPRVDKDKKNKAQIPPTLYPEVSDTSSFNRKAVSDNSTSGAASNNIYHHRVSDDPRYSTAPIKDSSKANGHGVLTLPLHGKIAAGTPIEALENVDSYIDIPYSMAAANGCYALTVSGDSMIEKGILNGDIVIIHSTQNAKDGDIVVALIDQEEATLKTLKLDGANILLVPANISYPPQQYCAKRVQVQGKLVGLVRSYS